MNNKIEKIHEAAQKCGGEVWDNYSGRGMYGATCYGIDCDSEADLLMAIGAVGLPKPKLDSMGLGIIAYWPAIKQEMQNT